MATEQSKSKNTFTEIEVERGIFLSPDDIESVGEITYKWDYKERGPNGKYRTVEREDIIEKNNNGGFSFTIPEGPRAGSLVVLVESPKAKQKKKVIVDGTAVIERVEYDKKSVKVVKGVTIPIRTELAKKFSQSKPRAVSAVI